MKQKSYNTITEALTDLKKLGYIRYFSIMTDEDCLVCHLTAIVLSPEDFEIDVCYRFEEGGDFDPIIVYAISSKINGLKGIVVDAYGINSGNVTSDILKKLHGHTDHVIIDIIDNIIPYDKSESSKEEDDCPIATCSVCWGYQEYNGKIVSLLKDKQIDVNNHSDSYSFIQEFVKTNIEGIKLKEGEVITCPKCGSKNNED